MTIEEMQAVLTDIGLRKPFRPIWDRDAEKIFIKTRRAAEIVDGWLRGTEIVLENDYFRVWTQHKVKAANLARSRGWKVRLWDGEAELWVPAMAGDEILPLFGAITKRQLSPAAEEAARARMRSLNFKISHSRPVKNDVPDTLPPKTAPEPM